MKVKREIRTAEQVLEVLSSETPLKFLVESLRYGLGDFDFRNDPVANGETIIGEMTELERVIHAAAINAGLRAVRVAEENNALVDATSDEEDPEFQHRVHLNKGEFKALDLLGDALNAWAWYSIKKRIGVSAMEPDGIGIRDGCVVVARTSEAVEGDIQAGALCELLSRLDILGRIKLK